MSALRTVNPNAIQNRGAQALFMNINAAKGLMDAMKTNLGPKGTLKMLVGGSGDIKLTKDGNVLLHEMQIQHPTASLIARAATAQDDVTGDGTTTCILLIAELLKQSERYLQEGLHPRVISDGFDLARIRCLEFVQKFAIKKTIDRELLLSVAKTSLRSKIHDEMADMLADIVTDAVLTIRKDENNNTKPNIDLFMVEIMTMQHKQDMDTRLIKGLVLDHGARHPDMPKRLKNAYIMILNVGLEYEKSEVNSVINYSSAKERQSLVDDERSFIDERVRRIIAIKKKLCEESNKTFCVINQKGIDPVSLDMLAKEGIIALRRAKRRNMERLMLATGGKQINALDDDVSEKDMGFAEEVYEHILGEDKYTFVEGVQNPFSCTILIKGPNKHSIMQTKDAIRDGLRSVKNTIEDAAVLPGAGAWQIGAQHDLLKFKNEVSGRAKLGVQAFADALLIVPKTLAVNSGFDPIDSIIKLQERFAKSLSTESVEKAATLAVGLDLETGDLCSPEQDGIWDNVTVVKHMLNSASVIASQLLLVDEILRAGKNVSGAKAPQMPMQ